MAYQIKKDPISKIPKVQLAFWVLVRLAMLICAGYSFIHGDTVMGFESIFCFIFTHLWDLFQIFGNGSQTLLNIIIFIGIVFGSYLELFDKLAHFDDFMHLLSGFVCAAFGFDFARIIQRKKGPCAVTLAAIFGLMFAVTIAAGWEFYEFLMDTLHGTNLQLAYDDERRGRHCRHDLYDRAAHQRKQKARRQDKKINRKNKRTAMHRHCGSFLSLSVFYSVFWAVSRSWSISSSSDGWCTMQGLPWAVQPVRRYG